MLRNLILSAWLFPDRGSLVDARVFQRSPLRGSRHGFLGLSETHIPGCLLATLRAAAQVLHGAFLGIFAHVVFALLGSSRATHEPLRHLPLGQRAFAHYATRDPAGRARPGDRCATSSRVGGSRISFALWAAVRSISDSFPCGRLYPQNYSVARS